MELKIAYNLYEIERNFPSLFEMIRIMYHDNGGRKELHKVDAELFFAPTDMLVANRIAERLDDGEKETVAAGDQDEAAVILKKHTHSGILMTILSDLFDGDQSIMHA